MLNNRIQVKCVEKEIIEDHVYEKYWYIYATTGSLVKYLHKDGTWQDSCYTPHTGMYSGHYETKEEAIEYIKKYTKFRFIYDEDEKLLEIQHENTNTNS